MELRPGLDLSAAWKTHKKVRRQAGTVVARMREKTDIIKLAPASMLLSSAEAKGVAAEHKPENGRIAVGFTRSDLERLGAPDIINSFSLLRGMSEGQALVVGRVKEEFGPTISLDFHTPNARVVSATDRQYYRAAGVIDRAVAADDFDDFLDVSYLVSLVYEGFTPKSPELTTLCGYAFFELALWQVQNDLMTMTAELESERQPARISVALDGDDFLPTSIMSEMKSSLVEMLDDWDRWIPNRRGIVRPGRFYAFDNEVGLSDSGDREPS